MQIEVLPALEQNAQVQWSHLNGVCKHKKLNAAIICDLKDQYDKYNIRNESLQNNGNNELRLFNKLKHGNN